MQRIKLHNNCRLGKARQNSKQFCIHCNRQMLFNQVGVSISKPMSREVMSSPINVWIHVSCIKPFFEQLEMKCKEHEKFIFMENL